MIQLYVMQAKLRFVQFYLIKLCHMKAVSKL